MEHQELARAYFQSGRNCCQAIVCAYSEETGLTEATANALAADYEGGNYQGLCGALAGDYIVANFLKGTPELDDPARCKDDQAGKLLVEMTQAFEQACGSLYCRQLIGKKVCTEYVAISAEILETVLAEEHV